MTPKLPLMVSQMLVPSLLLLAGCAAGNDDKDDDDDDTGTTDIDDSSPDDSDPGDSDPGTDSDEPVDTAAEAQANAEYAAHYDPTTLRDLELTLSADSLAALRTDPDTYVIGDLRIDTVTLTDVGVRLRGGADGEDLDAKPAFKIKLDEFKVDNDYGDLERIVLDNLEDDRTQVRLVLALNLLNEAGIPAPRAAFARLSVNGEPYGLYATIEEVDSRFVNRHYADDGGDLWEAEDSADFTAAGVNHFEPVAGSADLGTLEDAASLVAGADFYTSAGTIIDLDQFVTYWAWMLAIGSNDSYPYDLNDYYIYANPEDGKYELVPWAVDEGWDTGMTWDAIEGTLGFRCRGDTTCYDALKVRTREVLTTFATMNVADTAQATVDMLESEIQTDPRRTRPLSEVLAAQTDLVDRLATWPDRVRADMGL